MNIWRRMAQAGRNASSTATRAAGGAGGMWRNARLGRKLAQYGPRPRSALVAAGGAMDIGVQTAKMMSRAAGRGLNFAAKHPVSMTLAGVGTMGGVGLVRGSMAAVRSSYPVPQTNQALPPVQGPGYQTWGKYRGGGMMADNLGATGDLTLAMHKQRHR